MFRKLLLLVSFVTIIFHIGCATSNETATEENILQMERRHENLLQENIIVEFTQAEMSSYIQEHGLEGLNMQEYVLFLISSDYPEADNVIMYSISSSAG